MRTEHPIVAIDFDGTIVEHQFPDVGKLVPGAKETISDLHKSGCRLILYTMRSGPSLNEAIQFLRAEGLAEMFWAFNSNPEQSDWTSSPKVHAEVYIDDAALGCPMMYPKRRRAYVDWRMIRLQLIAKGLICKPAI